MGCALRSRSRDYQVEFRLNTCYDCGCCRLIWLLYHKVCRYHLVCSDLNLVHCGAERLLSLLIARHRQAFSIVADIQELPSLSTVHLFTRPACSYRRMIKMQDHRDIDAWHIAQADLMLRNRYCFFAAKVSCLTLPAKRKRVNATSSSRHPSEKQARSLLKKRWLRLSYPRRRLTARESFHHTESQDG